MQQLVHRELIFMDVEADSSQDVIRQLGSRFEELGLVKDSYVAAVCDREKIYPTGLQLEEAGVAMPHTTGSHVNTPAICIAKLTKPVLFYHMGTEDSPVQAEMIFMLAILDPNDQLDLLQNIMGIFTDKDKMAEFRNADCEDALFAIAQKHIDKLS